MTNKGLSRKILIERERSFLHSKKLLSFFLSLSQNYSIVQKIDKLHWLEKTENKKKNQTSPVLDSAHKVKVNRIRLALKNKVNKCRLL